MTENEAIEELKDDCNELGKEIPCDTGWGIAIESAYAMAIKALEKQIPKKVAWGKTATRPNVTWICPSCRNHVNAEYCRKCGQKLDWSDDK